MKKPISILLVAITFTIHVNAQYIYEVLEYVPAPGQLININPWGTPSSAFSIQDSIDGHLSLGAFGGYVVFRFENPVENDPDNPFGVDFTIFGNAITGRSEPGIVQVMEDENENGLADDNWYELVGSEYYFNSCIKDYEVEYYNPGDTIAQDVFWIDNQGNEGYIYANSFYKQPYYPNNDTFPWIGPVQYSLHGTSIPSIVDSSNPGYIQVLQRGFGYADNHVRGSGPWTLPDNPYTYEKENSGGDAFDISWAVDSMGNYIHLDKIDFVRVHTAVLGHTGWLGEISTEITGAIDIPPDPGIIGETDMVVIKPADPIITTEDYQMHALAFRKGKPMFDENLIWSVNSVDAIIDNTGLLSVSESGEYEVSASMQSSPDIEAFTVLKVDLSSSEIEDIYSRRKLCIYPNPANDYIYIDTPLIDAFYNIELLDSYGRNLSSILGQKISDNLRIDVKGINSGIYLVRVVSGKQLFVGKFIKQ